MDPILNPVRVFEIRGTIVQNEPPINRAVFLLGRNQPG